MRSWVDRYKVHPAVRELAVKLTGNLPQKNFSAEVSALFYYVRDKIRYLKDVNGVETLQSPLQTLRLRAGDCDDKVTLLGALLESIGHPVRFQALGFSPGRLEHVIAECYIGGQWVALDATEPVAPGWNPKGAVEKMTNHSNLAGFSLKDIGKVAVGAVSGFASGGYTGAAIGGGSALLNTGGGGGGGGGYPYGSYFEPYLTPEEITRWGPAGPCPRWAPGVNNKATAACDALAQRINASGASILASAQQYPSLPSPAYPFPPYAPSPGYAQPAGYAPTPYLAAGGYSSPGYPMPAANPSIFDSPYFWPGVLGALGVVLFVVMGEK